MKKIHKHTYTEKELGRNSTLHVICEYDNERGFISVTGLEHNAKDGYAYFCFDDTGVENLDASNKEAFMAYLDDSTDKGFSCAWFETIGEVLDEFGADNALLKKLVAVAAPDVIKLRQKDLPKSMTITLEVGEMSLGQLREKFEIRNEQDLYDAIMTCVFAYLGM